MEVTSVLVSNVFLATNKTTSPLTFWEKIAISAIPYTRHSRRPLHDESCL